MLFKKKKKTRRFFGYLLLTTIVFFSIFVTFIEEIFELVPPDIAEKEKTIARLEKEKVQEFSQYKSIGNCWLKKERGLDILFLQGSPFVRGWYAGQLSGKILKQQEDIFLKRIGDILDSDILLWGLRKVGYVVNRNLASRFPSYMRKELYGFSCAVEDHHPELGSPYFRSINYQAAHDTGHQVANTILSLAGCTSFAVRGEMSQGGHLILGRNFDFEVGDFFDRFKILKIISPKEGIPFISIGWAGMFGVVSGVNKELIAVTINAGKSDHFKLEGTPVVVLARRILQEAHNLKEAVKILESSHSYVTESFLIADGKNGEMLVVEKSPQITKIRKPGTHPDALLCVNHFFSKEFQQHESHQNFVKEGSSVKRLERLRELIFRHKGKINPKTAASILRDYKLPGDLDIGLGHLHTINPSICSHSVIMDLTEGILWVSQGPHQSNQYLPIQIQEIFQQSPESPSIIKEKIIQKDSFLGPQKVEEIRSWRKTVQFWKKKQENIDLISLKNIVKVLTKLNPESFITMIVMSDLKKQKGQYLEAKVYLEKSLAKHPYPEWIKFIKKRRNTINRILKNSEASPEKVLSKEQEK